MFFLQVSSVPGTQAQPAGNAHFYPPPGPQAPPPSGGPVPTVGAGTTQTFHPGGWGAAAGPYAPGGWGTLTGPFQPPVFGGNPAFVQTGHPFYPGVAPAFSADPRFSHSGAAGFPGPGMGFGSYHYVNSSQPAPHVSFGAAGPVPPAGPVGQSANSGHASPPAFQRVDPPAFTTPVTRSTLSGVDSRPTPSATPSQSTPVSQDGGGSCSSMWVPASPSVPVAPQHEAANSFRVPVVAQPGVPRSGHTSLPVQPGVYNSPPASAGAPVGYRTLSSPGFPAGEVSPISGLDHSSPQLHARSTLRPTLLAGHFGHSGTFTQFRENGAPRDQVNLFAEGVDGPLLRTMRLDLSTPLAVSIREESSVLPLVSDTSGLVFRRPILEALLVNRQV